MPPESALRDGQRPDFRLIETLRWEPATGFLRLDRHMARLTRSARALGFRLAAGAVETALAAAASGDGPLRLRLTLGPDGDAEVSAQAFLPQPPGTVWHLRIAKTRLEARDPLIRHKTTRRSLYEAARAEYPREEADEVILLNSGGMACEGTITNLFVGDGGGRYLTPPLACGLLPGVLREELLAEGRAREAEITPAMLREAEEILVGNSLRGLIRGKII